MSDDIYTLMDVLHNELVNHYGNEHRLERAKDYRRCGKSIIDASLDISGFSISMDEIVAAIGAIGNE